MIFTREDILKILNALLQLGRKDSEFKDANTPLNSNDEIAIIQDGINKKVSINNLLSTLGLLKKDDFINVSDRYDEYYIRLSEAITIIANNKRKKGLVITFLDIDGNWRIYLFIGELNNFIITDYWKELHDFKYPIINTVLPDEEDLTLTYPNIEGNSFIKLKDKEYDLDNFSGLGKVILRKNIIEVEDPTYGKIKKNILYQDMINKSNTIYVIQYDFTLGEDITIPENCVLEFYGGSINGTYILNLNFCQIIGSGLNCKIDNPIQKKGYNLSKFISNLSDTNLNRLVVQKLIDNKVDVIIDYSSIEFNAPLVFAHPGYEGFIFKGCDNMFPTLNFPTSIGFVWKDRIAMHHCYFENFKIITKGHCFDFYNSEDNNHSHKANWIYRCIFKNIWAISTNGSCFFAGSNFNTVNGDAICFSHYYENIIVGAASENGCGFYGINSNTNLFVKVTSLTCTKACFYNCQGQFDSFNQEGDSSRTQGPSLLIEKDNDLARPNGQVRCTFINGTFEHAWTNSSIVINDNNAEGYLTFDNCTFFRQGYPIIKLATKTNITLINPIVYAGEQTTNSEPFIETSIKNMLSIGTTKDIKVHDISENIDYAIKPNIDNWTFGYSRNMSSYNKLNISDFESIKTNFAFIENLVPRPYIWEIDNTSTNFSINDLSFPEKFYISCTCTNDVEGNTVYFRSVSFTWFNDFAPNIFFIKNNTKNVEFRFLNNDSSWSSHCFVTHTGSTYVLKPGETAICVVTNDKGKIYILSAPKPKYLAGPTRPTDGLYKGQSFFDESLTPPRPIYWDGTKWVDATGTSV